MNVIPRLPSSRGREADPWPVVAALGAAAVYALHGLDGILTRDLGVYAYAGQRVAAGDPPYVGIFNRAGPLAHLLPGLGAFVARIGGSDDLATIRALFLGLAALSVSVSYLLGRDLFGSRLAGAVTAAAMLGWHEFIDMAAYGPREKTAMVLFMLVAFLAAVRRRWLAAGVFVSLATLTLQIAFFVVGATVAVAVLTGPRRRWLPDMARVTLGGLVPLAIVTLYFAVVGALREFVDGFLLANARYTTSVAFLDKAEAAWAGIVNRYGVSTWWFVVGMAAVLLLPLLSWRSASRGGPSTGILLAFAAGAVAGLWWVLFQDFDSALDLFPLLPLAAVGVAGAVNALARRLPGGAAVAVPAVVAGVAVLSATVYSVGVRDERLDGQRRTVERALAVVPGATVLSVEAPQVLVLSGSENPVRHQMLSSGLHRYVDATWPGGLPAFKDSIVRDVRPELVALGGKVERRWVQRLDASYDVVGRAKLWVWLARESLGEERLAELRRTLRGGRTVVQA
jgi:hypothetical protein